MIDPGLALIAMLAGAILLAAIGAGLLILVVALCQTAGRADRQFDAERQRHYEEVERIAAGAHRELRTRHLRALDGLGDEAGAQIFEFPTRKPAA